MSATGTGHIRTLAFGDLDAGVWGCAWSETDGAATFGTLGSAAAESVGPATISGSSPSEDWTVSGPVLAVSVSPLVPAAELVPLDGFDQLCRVAGRATVDGQEHSFDCLGHRGVLASPDFAQLASLRELAGWFAPDHGLAVTALRPRAAGGHDQDSVIATLFEDGAPMPVSDPRLSSTYAGDGRLLKAGLELWLDDEQEPFPRRAAAEALGGGVRLIEAPIEVSVWPLLWRSRGEQGAGLYLRAVPR